MTLATWAAEKVTIDKDNTTIVNGGAKDQIDARIGQIKAQIETTTSDAMEKLQER